MSSGHHKTVSGEDILLPQDGSQHHVVCGGPFDAFGISRPERHAMPSASKLRQAALILAQLMLQTHQRLQPLFGCIVCGA